MSMLGLSDLLRRKENNGEDDQKFDSDGTFEHEIGAALDLEVGEELLNDGLQDPLEAGAPEAPPDEFSASSAEIGTARPDVLTPHAQAVMAAFSVFDEANNTTREELAKIGKAFTSIVTNYNVGRQFLDSCRQEIARASELEQANQGLVVENRRLLERTEKQERARERLDDLLESSKRREARLIQDCDNLRMNVSELRLEVIDLRNANTAAEHARSEMHMALAAKTAEMERTRREGEVLREKLAGVTAELDLSHKRQVEAHRRLEDIHSQHTAEVSKYAELNGKAAAGDKEVLRLQKQCDTAEALLKETNLALQNAEHELWERDRRHQAELQALKTENEQLSGRLQQFSDRAVQAEEADNAEWRDQDTVPVIPLRSRKAEKAKPGRRATGGETASAAE